MPVKWITVRHGQTGGETQVPDRSVPGYCSRGWRPLEGPCCGLKPDCPLAAPAKKPDVPTPVPTPALMPRRDESGDNNSEKE